MLGGLWVFGFSLNTITLFGLILTLGLIVDDAIVISESIDANGRESEPVGVIRTAIDRVGSASFAGTLTTVVVFSPMLFVGGILGEFIRSIPATVIITLLLSFLFSIVFIPAVARRFLLKGGPSQPGARKEWRLLPRRTSRRLSLAQRLEGLGFTGGLVTFALVMVGVAVLLRARSRFLSSRWARMLLPSLSTPSSPPARRSSKRRRSPTRSTTWSCSVLGDEVYRSQ